MQSKFHSLQRECMPRMLVNTLAIFLRNKKCESVWTSCSQVRLITFIAYLLCNVVYSQSFLKSSGTDDLCKGPAWWHRQILTQIFDFLLPLICHTLLSQSTAMLLYYFTPTAADIPFYIETRFPALSSDNQRLSSSVHSARGQLE